MTKLYSCLSDNGVNFALANDADDLREILVAAGRMSCVADLNEKRFQDITAQAMKFPGAASLKALMDASKRGCVYAETSTSFTFIPLSTEAPWLHHDATELVACPACGAPEGQPCIGDEQHPIYEGTAHRRRVRALVREVPQALEAPQCQ